MVHDTVVILITQLTSILCVGICFTIAVVEFATSFKDSDKAFVKLTSITTIDAEFAKMTRRIKEALHKNEISVTELIEQLCATSAVHNKKVPIFDEDMYEKSIDELWRKLKNFWNIFDYDLLILVINLSECTEAKEILDNFLEKIDPCALDVDLVLHCEVFKKETWPLLRIKVNTERCTPDVKNKVKDVVSKMYNLQKYALRFTGIKEGCVEFVYSISRALASYLLEFRVTGNIMTDFVSNNIICLQINDMRLKVPPSIPKMVSSGDT